MSEEKLDLVVNDNYYQPVAGEGKIMVILLVLSWLLLVLWVPSSALMLWLSSGFALFALLLVLPSVSRHWYWLPVGGLAGLGMAMGLMLTEQAI